MNLTTLVKTLEGANSKLFTLRGGNRIPLSETLVPGTVKVQETVCHLTKLHERSF